MPRRILFLASLCFVRTSLAADATAPVSVELRPNIDAISVYATITGDDDRDAIARLEVAIERGPFVRAHDLARIDASRFVGVALRLPPGATISARVTFEDPDGSSPSTITEQTMTRGDVPPPPNARDLFVDPLGDDSNVGAAGSPLRTIQRAVDLANPGDHVRVRAGTYRESIRVTRAGNDASPIWIRGAPGARVDGSDEAIATGSATWRDDGSGVFSAPSTETRYVSIDGERIYGPYATLADLRAENGMIGQPGVITGGFHWAGGRVYLLLASRGSPAGHDVRVAVRPSGFLVDTTSFVVIEGFELTTFGSAEYSGVGIDVRDAHDVWIRNNRFTGMNTGARVRRAQSARVVVEDNAFADTSVFGWPWDSVKAHEAEASAIEVTAGGGHVIRRNRLRGSFNGIYTGSFSDSSESIASDTDVYENDLGEHGDDGLELEGAQVSVRAYDNQLHSVYNAISLSPITVGPVFLARNLVDGYSEHAFKINNGPTGRVFVYHTTAIPSPTATEAQALAPSLPFGGFTFRNNVLVANRYVIEYGNTSLAGAIDLDHDVLFTNDVEGAGRFVKWLNVRYADIATLAGSETIEAHGRGDRPVLGADFALVSGNPLLDGAEPIPGFNDVFSGAGPDPGAIERSPPAPDGGSWDSGVAADATVDSGVTDGSDLEAGLPSDAAVPVDGGIAAADAASPAMADATAAPRDAAAQDSGASEPTTSDGCGCSAQRGRGGPMSAALLLLALRPARRRSSRGLARSESKRARRAFVTLFSFLRPR
ncbi:MAG: right-handed parallel beta-helix repeat-containing protein [Deltaproteobacteria bacterium]|nr:right-handed parallel beta-helix repeat-containing protein [Deltaproteobacteria bacterium]